MNRQRIRQCADDLRRQVLDSVIRGNPNAENARAYLHPMYAAQVLGYSYQEHPDLDLLLGMSGSGIGFFDRAERLIAVCDHLPSARQRFTGLHEVGHIILHGRQLPRAHRDKKVDPGGHESIIEWEANQFAKEYGMPEVWFRRDVERRFGQVPVKLDDDLCWRLDPHDPDWLWELGRDDLLIERRMARYAGFGFFPSLEDEYGMSNHATALRLKELDIVEKNGLTEQQATDRIKR